MELSILYRGPLASCNYGCQYCPFVKRQETVEERTADRAALDRFLDLIATRHADVLRIFFTPWGEALIKPWYREAIARLSQLPQVEKVAIQTNLSCRLNWLTDCNVAKLGFWCTYHPGQVARRAFLDQCRQLDVCGVRYSVGIVGRQEHADEAQQLRRQLSPEIYLWINACKDRPDYYTEEETEHWERLDPLFRLNLRPHESRGRACRTGHSVIAVDGDGAIRRCHFVAEPIGNLYQTGWEQSLARRPCPNATCGCHIGYVHMDELDLHAIFGDGVLERVIPRSRSSGLLFPGSAGPADR